MRREAPEKMLEGISSLQKLHNRGAALELHGENSKTAHRCYNSCYSRNDGVLRLSYKETKTAVLKTGVGMILGGAWSNVWDRITRKYVVDYFSFHTKCRKLERVVFNLADMFIFLGGFLVIFWNMLWKS